MGEVNPDLLAWVTKRWKKSGLLVKEILVGHLRGGGAPFVFAVLTKEDLAAFKDNKEVARDIDERCIEQARNYPGTVRFEVAMWSETRVIDTFQYQKKGEGIDTDSVDTTPAGQLAMYMREAHRDRELTITTLQKELDRKDRQIEKQYDLIDRLYAKHPELLDMMNKLADQEVEREIKRRQAWRIEGIKDRALTRLDQALPHLLSGLTGGKINLLSAAPSGESGSNPEMMKEIEPHLLVLLKSLSNAGERGLQIGALMNEEEQGRLLAIGAIVDKYATAKGDPGIGAKEKNGAGATATS